MRDCVVEVVSISSEARDCSALNALSDCTVKPSPHGLSLQGNARILLYELWFRLQGVAIHSNVVVEADSTSLSDLADQPGPQDS